MPILKADKVNKHPPHFPLPPPKICLHESSIDYLFTGLQSLDSLSMRMLEFSSKFHVLFLPFIVLLQNKPTTLAENGENVISTLSQISTHSQGPKIY